MTHTQRVQHGQLVSELKLVELELEMQPKRLSNTVRDLLHQANDIRVALALLETTEEEG